MTIVEDVEEMEKSHRRMGAVPQHCPVVMDVVVRRVYALRIPSVAIIPGTLPA